MQPCCQFVVWAHRASHSRFRSLNRHLLKDIIRYDETSRLFERRQCLRLNNFNCRLAFEDIHKYICVRSIYMTNMIYFASVEISQRWPMCAKSVSL